MYWRHAVVMSVVMIAFQVFAMPYVMTQKLEHVRFTISQLYLGVFMSAGMVAVDAILHPTPVWIWFVILAVAAAAVFAYRYQIGITDREWLREMIPHHSMALLTSEPRTKSLDPFVQRLAEQIIATQRREIGEMEVTLNTRPPR
jgi:O-antigen/teichoic acid export membrane protein